MSKLLEKVLKDAIKDEKVTMGTKQVIQSMKNSKLVVLSQSLNKDVSEKIESDAKKQKVPLVNFAGTSVALGKLCGLQFRVSTVSFTSLTDANIKSIIKESEEQ